MTITIDTKFNVGDRVWMPDGNGGREKGRIKSIRLFHADLTKSPGSIVGNSLNYECVDVNSNSYHFHEYQLTKREI